MKGKSRTILGVLLFLVLIVGPFVGCEVAYYNTVDSVEITVSDKGVKRSGDNDKYMIYTEGDSYEIIDLFWKGYWRSSDDYGHIQVGKTYKCDCYGWRWPFFSTYKNLKDCEEVKK